MRKPIFILLFVLFSVSQGTQAHTTFRTEPLPEKTPQEIINDYIDAIGGKQKIAAVKTIILVMEAEIQGMKIEIDTNRDMEGLRLMQQMVVDGNVMQKTVVKDNEGYMSMMGQVKTLSEDELATLKTNIYAFPEMHYGDMGFSVTRGENTTINGEEAYTLLVTNSAGLESKEYFSIASGLKLKMVAEVAGDIIFDDYEEVEGIMFPMKVTISNPMLPVPMETRVVSIQVNEPLDNSLFE
ncbi:hypothetical protein [Cyclobacterium marinum]|uniref:hypothetical protein n=1 Tax=Cyclobacterium marinum TaxID=104 RepID=UPI0005A4F629|nr:hypothetical protein [Cyclobacterium marinum]MBR9777060.1 peptidase, M16 family protein [Cytophagales bacterium]|tara:strand:+ start:5524 stop:6240 length:717 start_codon:yes stop_codon:yes gene_type:complete